MTKTSDIIPIFLICDDNYAPYMATMIASVCLNTKYFIEFHVVGKGISDKNKALIEEMKKTFPNFNIDYKVIDISKDFDISYLSLARMTSSTFIRMLLPDLFPEIDRALIMDVDMIALQDIASLWNESLDGYIWAAALDKPVEAAYYTFKKNMDVTEECKYANCGVMILDCQRWRDEKISQKCLDIEKVYRDKLNCADQDVINKVFLGDFKELDSRYNSLLGNEDNIANRHFCYLRKPWFSKYNVEGELIKNFDDWWKYAKMTPFYDDLKAKYDENNAHGHESAVRTLKKYEAMQFLSELRNNVRKKRLADDKAVNHHTGL